VLERAVALAGPGDFQPSGLALREGRLYTVSDKESGGVLEVDLERGQARVALPFHLPAGERGHLDLEGIAPDPVGGFLVVSEQLGRVLAIAPDGAGRWLPVDFVRPARAAGLLATAGAGFEGIALFGDRIVLAAERAPRGLVVARAGKAQAWQMESTRLWLPRGRGPDFADLTVYAGRLFALVRNAEAIVELAPAGERFEERRWWSFAAAVGAYPYDDQRFGMAEGLAIDDRRVYVVLDNNGSSRRGSPGDRRAMLFVFARPPEMGRP
jgi:hypothetical protein